MKIKEKTLLKKCQSILLAYFFPKRCPLCDKVMIYGRELCQDCEKKVPYIKEPLCKKCGKPIENECGEFCGDCSRKKHLYIQGKAVFAYKKEMKLSMYRFKYANRREYAEFYAEKASETYGKWIKYRGIEAVVPVPLYSGKQRKRGYNQAEIFAQYFGRNMGIPVEKNLIKRVRNTTPQKELNDKQRKYNLKGAFQVKANVVKYKKILLVDDIYTTGATVDAAAEVLMKAGITEVYVLCICIGENC